MSGLIHLHRQALDMILEKMKADNFPFDQAQCFDRALFSELSVLKPLWRLSDPFTAYTSPK